jgi:hypothetical protein
MRSMTKTIIATLAGAALLVGLAARDERHTEAQQAPTSLVVGLYAPSAKFADSAQRAAYVQGLAKAIQTQTGIPTTGKAFTRLNDLKAAKPDFAIIEGLCLASNNYGTVMATGVVNGDTSQSWALFTRGDAFGALKGKKLAYVETGCRDVDFLDNAMLDSEARVKAHFGSLVGKPDIAGAVATVRDYKQADGVFAPVAMGSGLKQIFDAGKVPNPGFVQMNGKVPGNVVGGVKTAIMAYNVNTGIESWKAPANYAGWGGGLSPRVKRPVFAVPEVVQMNDQDIIVAPEAQYQQTPVRQHFWKP